MIQKSFSPEKLFTNRDARPNCIWNVLLYFHGIINNTCSLQAAKMDKCNIWVFGYVIINMLIQKNPIS